MKTIIDKRQYPHARWGYVDITVVGTDGTRIATLRWDYFGNRNGVTWHCHVTPTEELDVLNHAVEAFDNMPKDDFFWQWYA